MKNIDTSVDYNRLRALNASNDIVARILAKENLRIEYVKASTAYFNTNTRTIYIPSWNVDNVTSLMLRCHELAHALFTGTLFFEDGGNHSFHTEESQKSIIPDNILRRVNFRTFFHYMNVCEDDRIERKVSIMYPGIRRFLTEGHNSLFDMGFYNNRQRGDVIRDDEILANKALFYSRFGINSPVQYNLSTIEREILSEMSRSDTFEDVVHIAYEMYCYDKNGTKRYKKEEQKEREETDESSETSNEPLSFDEMSESDDSSADKCESTDDGSESEDDAEEKSDSSDKGDSESSDDTNTGDSDNKSSKNDETGDETENESGDETGDESGGKASGDTDKSENASTDDETKSVERDLSKESFDSDSYYNHLGNKADMSLYFSVFDCQISKQVMDRIRVVAPVL